MLCSVQWQLRHSRNTLLMMCGHSLEQTRHGTGWQWRWVGRWSVRIWLLPLSVEGHTPGAPSERQILSGNTELKIVKHCTVTKLIYRLLPLYTSWRYVMFHKTQNPSCQWQTWEIHQKWTGSPIDVPHWCHPWVPQCHWCHPHMSPPAATWGGKSA